MCGIVGLHLRNPELFPQLGRIGDRHAVRDGRSRQRLGRRRRLRRPDLVSARARMRLAARGRREPRRGAAADWVCRSTQSDATYLLTAQDCRRTSLAAARSAYPDALVAGFGADLAVLKGVGHPRDADRRWDLAEAQGWQGVGHTRMATESAVTPAGCHPYAVGPEQCMVHNGSFANHATIRRELRAAGVRFDSENDTEVGARFIARQLADGRDVEAALKELCADV